MKPLLLAEHFFRHEYSRLVAKFSQQVGFQHFEAIEDSVQLALLKGLESWTTKGVPDNPTAWLYKVASNNLADYLRQNNNQHRILLQNARDFLGDIEAKPKHLLSNEFEDDLLRMMFVCCDDTIPSDSQLVLTLKTLCGFSAQEIAYRLFSKEANVYKRLNRAKLRLKNRSANKLEFHGVVTSSKLSNVHRILYVLFTEGYLSVNNDFSVRIELCEEAIRLATVLVNHEVGQTSETSETFALLALMQLHIARMASRQDETGGLFLLEEQDRNLWDKDRIMLGLSWLEKSATGSVFSRYHAEAGIAAEHCLAMTFEETRWDRIEQCYLLLEETSPSAIHRLNRAIAVAECRGPQAGLAVLEGFAPPEWLLNSYLWVAVQADLYLRSGNDALGQKHLKEALSIAPTKAIKRLLKRRFNIVWRLSR